MSTEPKERQARSRQARAADGGRQIAVMLIEEASQALKELEDKGETITGAINRLLIQTKAPRNGGAS